MESLQASRAQVLDFETQVLHEDLRCLNANQFNICAQRLFHHAGSQFGGHEQASPNVVWMRLGGGCSGLGLGVILRRW